MVIHNQNFRISNMEEFGVLAVIEFIGRNINVYTVNMAIDGSPECTIEDGKLTLDLIEVTAPELSFLDAVNQVFGLRLYMSNFSGR